MKRALIIFAAVLVLAGVGVGVYFYLASRTPGITVAPGDTTLPTAGEGTEQPIDTPSAPQPVGGSLGAPARLVQISKGPVVPGMAVVAVPAANASSTADTAVYYIERQSGNVFNYLVRTGTVTRTNNRTIPGIQSAAWLPDASTAFVRYLSGADLTTINTYALPAQGASGYFLQQNLSDIAVSSTTVLTLASGVNGSVAATQPTSGAKTSTVFTTPLSSLRATFAGKGSYLAFTKPSATLSGSAFMVTGGAFTRIAGPLDGLVALASPQGKWVVVSYVQNASLQTKLINATTNETIPLPINTIVDKCVWATDDLTLYCGVPVNPPSSYAYPDDWYQGAVQFSDRLWKIDVNGRYAQLVLDFSKEAGTTLDAHALAVDARGTTLSFINKNDGSLWSYQL